METSEHTKRNMEVALTAIASTINEHIEATSIHCFGVVHNSSSLLDLIQSGRDRHRSHCRFYLLVLAERYRNNALADIMDLVEKKSDGRHSVTVILQSVKQVTSTNDGHRHFFKRILESGWLVDGKQPSLEELRLVDIPEVDGESIDSYTSARLDVARDCLSRVEEKGCALFSSHLLRMALEQLFLGLLYGKLHFRPDHFHLRYLYHLSNFAVAIPNEVFPELLFDHKRYGAILSASHSELRYRGTDLYSMEDIGVLNQYCQSLLEYLAPLLSTTKTKGNGKR